MCQINCFCHICPQLLSRLCLNLNLSAQYTSKTIASVLTRWYVNVSVIPQVRGVPRSESGKVCPLGHRYVQKLSQGSTGTSSSNCQEKETCMAQGCYTPRQPFPKHPVWYLRGLATPWSVEEMPDGQHQTQRVDIPAHARIAHNCLLQKKKNGEDSVGIVPRVPPTTKSIKGLNCTAWIFFSPPHTKSHISFFSLVFSLSWEVG